MAIRLQSGFKVRSAFEAKADDLHDQFFKNRGISEVMHIQEHRLHLQRATQARENRPATEHELHDVESMLKQRGVAPMSESFIA